MRHLILIIAVFYSFSLVSQNSEKKDKMMVTLITRAPKLENSIDFYKKLAFKQLPKPTFKTVAQQEAPRAEAVFFTDGKMVIEVSADIFVRAGLKMYKKSWASEISKLEAITKVFKTKDGYLLYDPSGIAIYLVEYEFNVDFIPADSAFSHLGNYQGLTVESPDIEKAFKVYENLGFKLKMGEAAKGFVGLVSPDNFTVTLLAPQMCPHMFFNPSVTYFNGKNNPGVIKKIRELNIPITEEIGVFNKIEDVDNIIIRDPGGFGFFIFND